MDPRSLLPAIADARSAPDLGRVFARLGYAPDDTPAEDGWTLVARWKSYHVLATLSSEPREAARRMARRLAASARPGLAAALGSDELALSAPRIGSAGATPALAVPRAHPDAAALSLLASLGPAGAAHPLALALRIGERLLSEEAGERFFRAFREAFDRMEGALDGRGTADDRRLAALLALTRILFLYFIQARGWLDGRRDWLRATLDVALAQQRPFHRTVLDPLFFGTLNRPPAHRTRAVPGVIPYLNGGLFERHPAERRLGEVSFSNAMWRDVFDGLFERFRFCVREGDEVDTIAPDMLGRVFERVMDSTERHTTGTFYTPEHLVREIVEETLTAVLAGEGWPAEPIRRILTGEPADGLDRPRLRRRLRRIRLVDPAVGSGAFLLGALETLTGAHLALRQRRGPRDALRLRRRILGENLHGVDRSPVAVRLAELRLWLAVVAHDPTDEIADVAPLPNLDGIVRQGDSLLDPVSAARRLAALPDRHLPAAEAVREARTALFTSRGRERHRAEVSLREAELRVAAEVLERAERSIRAALRELIAAARSRDLFGRRAGFSEPQARRRRTLRRRLGDVRRARRALADGTLPFFAFEVHFPEVAAAGGFDVVVGNPPWVRAERLDASLRQTLKDRFAWWRSDGGDGFGHLPDLAIAFLERAFELTAPGGAVGLLVPSKLASAGYGASARAAMVRETCIDLLHRVPDRDAAQFGATTYPLVVVARRDAPDRAHSVRLGFGTDVTVRQSRLGAAGPWILVPDHQLTAVERFLDAGTPLGAIAPPCLGVKTGADRLLAGRIVHRGPRTSTLQLDGGDVELESEVVRPALRGRDIAPWRARPSQGLLWGYDDDGVPLERLPKRAARWIATVHDRLGRRTDYEDGPPWTLFRLRGALAPHRVVWADIARRPAAVILAPGVVHGVPLNSCYVAAAPTRRAALVVAGVMNSTWALAAVRALADEARGGYRRINARVAGRMPLPPEGAGAARIAALARRSHTGDPVDQSELDRAVADALALPRTVRRDLFALAGRPG